MHGERLQQLLVTVRDYAEWLGMSGFEVFTSDEDPWLIVELHGYDSWSHYQRLSQKETPTEVQAVYEAMDGLIEGGLKAIVSETWTPIALPRTE